MGDNGIGGISMPTKTIKDPIRIPKVPKNLFRLIWSIISKKPERYYMGSWHIERGEGVSGADELLKKHGGKSPTRKELKSCNTVHCTAGWTTYATPGGLKLEHFLEFPPSIYDGTKKERMVAEKFDAWWDSQSSYVKRGDSETAQAALLMLEKSGWAPYISDKDFYTEDRIGKAKLKKLMELETKYDGPPPPRKKKAKKTTSRSKQTA
jgi:hypothetical protein